MIDRHGVEIRHGCVCYIEYKTNRFKAFIVFEHEGALQFVYRHDLDKGLWNMYSLDILDPNRVSVRFNIAQYIAEWHAVGKVLDTPWTRRWDLIRKQLAV